MWENSEEMTIFHSNPLLQITILINCLSLAGLHWLVVGIDSTWKIQRAGWTKRGTLTSRHLVPSSTHLSNTSLSLHARWLVFINAKLHILRNVALCWIFQAIRQVLRAECLTVCVGMYFGAVGRGWGWIHKRDDSKRQLKKTKQNYFII